jgi:hypothetical protein
MRGSALILLFAAGCCIGPPVTPPPPLPCGGAPCIDAGPAFVRDAGPPIVPPRTYCDEIDRGGSCTGSCSSGLTCFAERTTSTSVDLGGGATAMLDVVAFPSGMCSASCTSDEDCGPCGARCVPFVLAGRARLRGLAGGGVCREPCSPFSTFCPTGYACDADVEACVEACTSDEQCRFVTVDEDGDGMEETLRYEASTPMRCLAGRCELPAGTIGGRCTFESDCDPGFTCLRDDRWPSSRAGRCALVGCLPGGCGDGVSCARVGTTDVCALSCSVGAEVGAEISGPSGHGSGCDPGFACEWLGAAGDPAGACLPAEYNAVAAPNVGLPCARDGDCFSPWGRGFCLRPDGAAGDGVCSVRQCVPDGEGAPGLLPGVAVDPALLCDAAAGVSCVRFDGTEERSACVRRCTAAEECVPGWACVRALGTSIRVCAPSCTTDSDCVAGGRCLDTTSSPCAPGLACMCR